MATTPLLERLKKNSTIKETALISESSVYHDRESIPTDIPILNLALSGRFDGGIECGLLGIGAPSKHFKTNIMLKCVSAYMEKHKDAVCMFYDSEFGSPAKYFESFNIDIDRVLHTPISTVEDLRHDMAKQLTENINVGDKVIIIIDSIGNLASNKELNDAVDGNEKSDMTRAKVIKSLFRIIVPKLNMKKIPCIFINHTYEELGCLAGDTLVRMADDTLLPIKDIKVGDKVIADDGSKQIVEHIFTPEELKDKAEIYGMYEIVLDEGTTIKCTGNHKFLTTDGRWVMAKDLTMSDEIDCIS